MLATDLDKKIICWTFEKHRQPGHGHSFMSGLTGYANLSCMSLGVLLFRRMGDTSKPLDCVVSPFSLTQDILYKIQPLYHPSTFTQCYGWNAYVEHPFDYSRRHSKVHAGCSLSLSCSPHLHPHGLVS